MASDKNRRKGRGNAAAADDVRARSEDVTHPGVTSPLGSPPPAPFDDSATDPQAVNPLAQSHERHSAETAQLQILPPAPAQAAGPRKGSLASRVSDAAAAKLLLFDDLPADEKPRQNDRVLLLGIVWGNETLIELEQIAKGGDLKVGELFDLPASNLPKEFRLISHVGEELVISVPSDLNAEVHHSGGQKTDTLQALSAIGKARKVDAPFSGYAYTVQSDDRIVVQIAPQLMLIARYVRAARQPQRSIAETIDINFTTILLIALLALGLFWLILQITPRFDDMNGDDLSRNQARMTQYVVKPEDKPKFKELSGAKEGAKAKDAEGKFGQKDKPKKDADPSKKGAPVVDPNKKEEDRKKVMNSGLLAALSKMNTGQESAASNVLGPGGIGSGINNALGGVKGGAGQGDAYGVGGLGSRGNGGGGGGTALGIGGLGTGGTGKGKGGFGVNLGGRGKDDTEFIPGKTTIVGGLSREVINRVIQRHYNEVKYCYEKELTKDPGLYGKVEALFVINSNGSVGDAMVQQTTMSNETVESCIINHVKRWIFPAAQGTTQVSYPYVFKASGQ
jgi:hypothetical protein